jgi:hypothetical protein
MKDIFPVADWEIVPVDVYVALFAEVKERFDVITEETVSVTEKSIKCLLGFITYYFGVGVFLLKEHYVINWPIYMIITICSGLVIYQGYKVIRLRPSHTTGLLPENVLSKDFNSDSGFNDDEKIRLFYYNAIKTYSQKIEEGTEDSSKRADKYDKFLRYTLFMVLVIIVFLLFTISYHPLSVKSSLEAQSALLV